jgi:hypothetical protein
MGSSKGNAQHGNLLQHLKTRYICPKKNGPKIKFSKVEVYLLGISLTLFAFSWKKLLI